MFDHIHFSFTKDIYRSMLINRTCIQGPDFWNFCNFYYLWKKKKNSHNKKNCMYFFYLECITWFCEFRFCFGFELLFFIFDIKATHMYLFHINVQQIHISVNVLEKIISFPLFINPVVSIWERIIFLKHWFTCITQSRFVKAVHFSLFVKTQLGSWKNPITVIIDL